ncbi:MAG TPA: oligopeptide/dipeptide ABC transporter ATP-binding protein, partial [Paracoccaceae bacterium]|nr:oligopeptide/dipeptide ABC transporter ATP-binding protein [Paracoccaceae bacterium]
GQVMFDGKDLLTLSTKEMNRVRANRIGMIFQDAMTSLNPYLKVSDQLTEVLMLHKGMSKKDALAESIRMLDAVRIPEAKKRVHMYPHESSGGMRQRIMIAMALLCRPELLIADEPTTALDVTVQAQIMQLLREIQREFGTAIMLITHDLGVVAGSCEDTLVMYGGQVMEHAATTDIFRHASHPYTRGLLTAVPRLDHKEPRLHTIPGNPPNMMKAPKGCPFAPRCTSVAEVCRAVMPPLLDTGVNNQMRACHIPVEELR